MLLPISRQYAAAVNVNN